MGKPRVFSVHGVILKRRNAGEADRIVTIYSREYGKLTVLAKGVRRIHSRRSAHLEPFRIVEATVRQSKGMEMLEEVVARPLGNDTAYDLDAVALAYYICELVDKLSPPNEPQEEVYGLLSSVLETVFSEKDPPVRERKVRSFARSLLQQSGFLRHDTVLADDQIDPYIERIIERKLRSPSVTARIRRVRSNA